jgi:hypothetical protein
LNEREAVDYPNAEVLRADPGKLGVLIVTPAISKPGIHRVGYDQLKIAASAVALDHETAMGCGHGLSFQFNWFR